MNLEVLKTITDVNGTESVWGEGVEELVAWPLERPDHDRLAALIQLEGPRAARLVICGRFEEAFVERGGREVKLRALLLILHISEMQVAVKAHTVGDREASESLIPAHLVLWGHLEGANWANLTVVLDSMDDSSQTIKFYIIHH